MLVRDRTVSSFSGKSAGQPCQVYRPASAANLRWSATRKLGGHLAARIAENAGRKPTSRVSEDLNDPRIAREAIQSDRPSRIHCCGGFELVIQILPEFKVNFWEILGQF